MAGHHYNPKEIITIKELVRIAENMLAVGAGKPDEAEVQRWMQLFECEAPRHKSIL
jgi:hypothetical protein